MAVFGNQCEGKAVIVGGTEDVQRAVFYGLRRIVCGNGDFDYSGTVDLCGVPEAVYCGSGFGSG